MKQDDLRRLFVQLFVDCFSPGLDLNVIIVDYNDLL